MRVSPLEEREKGSGVIREEGGGGKDGAKNSWCKVREVGAEEGGVQWAYNFSIGTGGGRSGGQNGRDCRYQLRRIQGGIRRWQ